MEDNFMTKKIGSFFHSKVFIITALVLLIGSIIFAGTYAWFTWSSTNNTRVVMSIGELADIIFDTGPDINTDSLAPVFNYEDGEKTTFSIVSKYDGNPIGCDLLLGKNGESVSSSFNGSLKYTLVENVGNTRRVVSSSYLNIPNFNSGVQTIMYHHTIDSVGTTNYELYIYLDANVENNLNIMGESFLARISLICEEGGIFS